MEELFMRFLVSACLAGLPCRFDAQAKPDPRIVALYRSGRAVLICPESLSGLPVPRAPCERRDGRFYLKNGQDVSKEFEAGANAAFAIAQASGCRQAILKARSPSCGVGQIYDGSFSGNLCHGNGLFAQKLLDAGWEVTDEDNLALFGL